MPAAGELVREVLPNGGTLHTLDADPGAGGTPARIDAISCSGSTPGSDGRGLEDATLAAYFDWGQPVSLPPTPVEGERVARERGWPSPRPANGRGDEFGEIVGSTGRP